MYAHVHVDIIVLTFPIHTNEQGTDREGWTTF